MLSTDYIQPGQYQRNHQACIGRNLHVYMGLALKYIAMATCLKQYNVN